MKVMLDNGISGHSQFAEYRSIKMGPRHNRKPTELGGFVRERPEKDPDQQREKDALFTIGRLIREDRLQTEVALKAR